MAACGEPKTEQAGRSGRDCSSGRVASGNMFKIALSEAAADRDVERSAKFSSSVLSADFVFHRKATRHRQGRPPDAGGLTLIETTPDCEMLLFWCELRYLLALAVWSAVLIAVLRRLLLWRHVA